MLRSIFLTEIRVLHPHQCKPTPTAVKVPGIVPFPAYVTLKVCMGACNMLGDSMECVATKRKKFYLKYIEFYFLPIGYRLLPMTEDEDCGCRCAIQPSDCDATQIFDSQACMCKCMDLSHTCNNLTVSSEEKQFILL